MKSPSKVARRRRSVRVRERRVTITATATPSSRDIQVASTAIRREFASAVVTGTSSAWCEPGVWRAR